MATIYSIHPENPQTREIAEITLALKKGALMLYPTDTVYAIGCDLNVKSAVQKVRQLKQLSNNKPLTFLCSSLSNISEYALVKDEAYRVMRRFIPGPYTFILPATKLVPKLVMDPKRKTTGIRVPDNPFCQAILESLGNPVISTSAHTPERAEEYSTIELEKAELFDSLAKLVDIIVDTGVEPGSEVSTILDLSTKEPIVIRQGLGWKELENWLTLV